MLLGTVAHAQGFDNSHFLPSHNVNNMMDDDRVAGIEMVIPFGRSNRLSDFDTQPRLGLFSGVKNGYELNQQRSFGIGIVMETGATYARRGRDAYAVPNPKELMGADKAYRGLKMGLQYGGELFEASTTGVVDVTSTTLDKLPDMPDLPRMPDSVSKRVDKALSYIPVIGR